MQQSHYKNKKTCIEGKKLVAVTNFQKKDFVEYVVFKKKKKGYTLINTAVKTS